MKTVYAFLADGMEEVEALMVIDLLRRTKKLNVVTVSIKDEWRLHFPSRWDAWNY